MNNDANINIDDPWILTQRPRKNLVSVWRPYNVLLEKERTEEGQVEDVLTIFLSNRECPFRCLMCDLWKNTTDARVPLGAIPEQIRWARHHASPTPNVKLYNSGNFFDSQAIPPEDYPHIADLLKEFRTVLVESHPRLINDRCLRFQGLLQPQLQVAMGLETIHPQVLPKLNKRMMLEDFERATGFLTRHDILVRAFILLRPPFMTESEGVLWARRTIDFACDLGVECCVVIPTRGGNGALERLRELGLFHPPNITSLEEVVEYGISLNRGRVFADLWDIERFAPCSECRSRRIHRLLQINLTQELTPPVECICCTADDKSP